MVTTQVATGEVYLLGGRYGFGSNGVARFDVNTNTFTRLQDIPNPVFSTPNFNPRLFNHELYNPIGVWG